MLYSITDKYSNLDPVTRWEISLKWIIIALMIFFIITTVLYNWIRSYVMTDIRLYNPEEKKQKKKKIKMGFLSGMKIVFSSSYLAYLAIMVIAYGVSINLVEVTWKSQMKLQFPDPAEYVKIMGVFSMTTGGTTIVLMIIGANILRRLGWFIGAIITPIVMLITGIGFFSFIVFGDVMSGLLSTLHLTPVFMAVVIGWTQNVMTKGAKYSLFDPTKEMSYIPLSSDLRIQGKAAVDGVGGRLGKSGGGIIQQIFLLSILGATQITIAPYIAIVMIFVVTVWIFAVRSLNIKFQNLTLMKNKEND